MKIVVLSAALTIGVFAGTAPTLAASKAEMWTSCNQEYAACLRDSKQASDVVSCNEAARACYKSINQ